MYLLQGVETPCCRRGGRIEHNLNELKQIRFSGSCNFVQDDGESPDFCRDDGKGRDDEGELMKVFCIKITANINI